MPRDASELAHRLAREAEAVCRHYLSNGRREGRYWLVGDVRNTPGRSMFVRLKESPKGPAGKWTDAATGEHGDLLDVIRESCGLLDFHDVADEARRFLSLPRSDPEPAPKAARSPAQTGSPEAARRLFAMSQPIARTLVETYLRNRGITALHEAGSAALPPALLLPARRGRADRDLAGDDRPRHRSRRPDHRRAPHLARSRRLRPAARQGADRHAATRDGRPSRQRRPLRCGERRARGRRRHRDHAVAALRAADLADGRGAFGQPPRRHAAPADAAPALHRPRRRCGRRRGGDGSDRTCRGGRHRGDRTGRPGSATSTRICARFGIDELRAALRIQLAPQDVVRFMLWATAETG